MEDYDLSPAALRALKVLRGHFDLVYDKRFLSEVLRVLEQLRTRTDDERALLRELRGMSQPLREALSEVMCADRAADAVKRSMEQYTALSQMQRAANERMATIKDERERRLVDGLIFRAFNPKCEWDRKNQAMLLTLAMKPDEVGWVFRVREYLHRLWHGAPVRHTR